MRKYEEINNPQSCWNRALDMESLFVLLGRDVAAPATIRFWVQRRILAGKNTAGDAQTNEALDLADKIELLQNSEAP